MTDAPLPDFDQLWDDATTPVDTEKQFQKLLLTVETLGDLPRALQVMTQIARAQCLQRKLSAAHSTLDQVERLMDSADTSTRVRYLLERGRIFNVTKETNTAQPLFDQAWTLANDNNMEYESVEAAAMLATTADDPEDQLAWAEKALAIVEASDDARTQSWLGTLYHSVGGAYYRMERYKRALEHFEKSLTWREARRDPAAIRDSKWSLGRAMRRVGRIQDALALQQSLAEQYISIGEESGYVQEELGECLLELGRAEKAREHFANAYRLLSTDADLVETEPDRLDRIKALSGEA